MGLKAMLSLKSTSTLRQWFDIGFNRGLMYSSIRSLRGRPRSQTGNDFENTNESQNEAFDEELDFSEHSKQMKPVLNRTQQIKQINESYEYYDSRQKRSPNLYERAKQLDFNNKYNNNYDYKYQNRNINSNTGNYENRRKFDRNNNRFESNESYENDLSYDKDFDYRDTHNENRFRNNYQGFNDRRNRFQDFDDRRNKFQDFDDRRNRFQDFEDRKNPFQGYDNRNQYNDRKQSRAYQSYKNKNSINEFNSEDNDKYSVDNNKFDFENGRPRFSRFREQEMFANKREAKLKRFHNQNNEELNVDPKEFQVNDEKDAETVQEVDNRGRERTLTSIPYNVTLENRFEILNQIVTPLHLKPYEYQLSIKYKKNNEILQRFGKKLKDINSPVVRDSKGLPCPLESVKESPITERYRNKDEYSIWPGVDGNRKTVGFFIGQPSIHHNVVCVEPDHIIVSKETHISLAKKFQNYLTEISKYDSCQNFGKGGNWRRFHVRSNEAGNHMAIAIMHPQELTQQELDEEMGRIREYFDGDERISSLYFQASRHTRSTHIEAPYYHLSGVKTITESLMDNQFEISPDSFFQINRSGAEVLYRKVISELNAGKNATVLDICCGTGTLANLIAPNVCRVIGIDSSQSAINDANKNASINGVKNVSFIVGTVEQQLPKLMDDLYSNDIIVVANPTRGGLHSSVVNVLREISFIHKIVYVSCYPEGDAFKNFMHLCMPSDKNHQHLGTPFVPTNAVPVDLFPHTNHCELIITFERF